MKKIFSLIITLILSLSLFSCGQKESKPIPDKPGGDIVNPNPDKPGDDTSNPTPIPNDLGLDIIKNKDEYILNGIGSCFKKEIVIPNYVTKIKSNAFPNITFERIIIPRSVRVIEKSAFSAENSFYIFCEAEARPDGWFKGFASGNHVVWGYNGLVGETEDGIKWALNKNNKVTIYNVDGKITEITQQTYEKITDYIVDSFADNLKAQVDYLFISKDITKIGEGAFVAKKIKVDSENQIYNSKGNCNAVIETKTNKLILGNESTIIPSCVTEIAAYAFDRVNKLNIPEGVKKIDSFAISFAGEIKLPKSLKCIEDSAIRYVNYEQINIDPANKNFIKNDMGIIDVENKTLIKGRLGIPNIVLENIKVISSLAYCNFGAPNFVDEVILPDSLESIGEAAFYNNSINRIKIPSNVKSIGVEAFNAVDNIFVDNRNKYYDSRDNCNAVIETKTNKIVAAGKNFHIPNTVKEIEKFGLEGGSTNIIDLRNIEVYPLSMASVDCNELIFGDIIPDAVCAYFTFTQYQGVNSVKMSNNVKVIGIRAFLQCRKLTTIQLSKNLVMIQQMAFASSGLESIYLPKTLNHIESNAFDSCYNLTTVYYNGTEEEFKKIVIESGNENLLNAEIIYNYTY